MGAAQSDKSKEECCPSGSIIKNRDPTLTNLPKVLRDFLSDLDIVNKESITNKIAHNSSPAIKDTIKEFLGDDCVAFLHEMINGQLTGVIEKSDKMSGQQLSHLSSFISESDEAKPFKLVATPRGDTWNKAFASFSQHLANAFLIKIGAMTPIVSPEHRRSRVFKTEFEWNLLQSTSKHFLALETHDMGIPFRRLLYADWESGRSLNTLLKFVRHYNAPSLLIFDDKKDGSKIAVLIQSKWDETGGRLTGPPKSQGTIFWGESLILSLKNVEDHQEVMVLHEKSEDSFFLNTKIKAHPMGIGIGGRPGMGRIFLDKDLADCYVTATCSVYDQGKLLRLNSGEFQSYFEVGALEIWGLGDAESYTTLEMHGKRDIEVRRQARLVDKTQLLENDFNREMLMGAKYQKHDQRGITDDDK